MAAQPGARTLLLSVAVILVVVGCGSWWRHQQRAAQERVARELCVNRGNQINARLEPIRADQQALQQIAAERYKSTPQPAAPDPKTASRYSQLDRQLDEERYQEQLAAWRWREEQRRTRWQQTQAERRQRVVQQLSVHLEELAAIDQQLVRAGQPNEAAIARLSDCDTAATASAQGARW